MVAINILVVTISFVCVDLQLSLYKSSVPLLFLIGVLLFEFESAATGEIDIMLFSWADQVAFDVKSDRFDVVILAKHQRIVRKLGSIPQSFVLADGTENNLASFMFSLNGLKD